MCAFSENPSYGREYLYGFGMESSFGTAVTAASGTCRLDNVTSVTYDRGIKFHSSKTGGSKDPLMTDSIPTVSGSIATINISAYVNRHTLKYWAKTFFQYSAAGVYSFFDTHPTTPLASMTFFVKDPVTGRDQIFPGCVAKSLKLSAEKGDDDLVKMDVELWGIGTSQVNQTIANSSSWKISGSKPDNYGRYGIADCTHTMSINGAVATAVAVQSWSINAAWDDITQENPNGLGGFTDVGFVGRDNCTLELTCLPDETVETIVAQLDKSAKLKFTVAGDLDIFCHAMVNKVDPSLDGLTKVSITGDIKAPDTSTNMIELTV